MIRTLALAYFVGRTPISVRRPLRWRPSLLRSASTVTSYQKREVPCAKAQEHVSHCVTPPQRICNFYGTITLDAVDWIAYLPEFFYHRSPMMYASFFEWDWFEPLSFLLFYFRSMLLGCIRTIWFRFPSPPPRWLDTLFHVSWGLPTSSLSFNEWPVWRDVA